MAVEDGIRPFRTLDDRQQRRLMRWLVLAIGAIAYFFALYEGVSLVVLLLSSYGIIAQFTPPLISALYWKRATTPGIMSGLLAGSAVTLFFFFQGRSSASGPPRGNPRPPGARPGSGGGEPPHAGP